MKRSPNSYVGAFWYKNQQNMLLDGLYHEDIAVLGQFCAEFISPQMQIAPVELRRQFMKLISLVCTNDNNYFGDFCRHFNFFQVSILVHPFHCNRRRETISMRKYSLNPLGPKGDQHQISPCNINHLKKKWS